MRSTINQRLVGAGNADFRVSPTTGILVVFLQKATTSENAGLNSDVLKRPRHNGVKIVKR